MLDGISLIQPWAWLVAAGHKPLENRTWRPPDRAIKEHLAIHASKKQIDADALDWLRLRFPAIQVPDQLPTGCILGVAKLDGFVTESDSPWYMREHPYTPGKPVYGWLFSDPVQFDDPVPCKGSLGLWRVPENVLPVVRIRYGAKRRRAAGA